MGDRHGVITLALALCFGVGARAADLPVCNFTYCPVCLPEASKFPTGRDVTLLIDGTYHDVPLRLGRCLNYWDTNALTAQFVGILAREKLGINVEYLNYVDEIAGFLSLNNCRDWHNQSVTDWCKKVIRTSKEAKDAFNAGQKKYSDPAPDIMWAPEFVPQTCCQPEAYKDTDIIWLAREAQYAGGAGFQALNGVYVYPEVVETALKDGVALGYYQAYKQPNKYFDTVQAVIDYGSCVATETCAAALAGGGNVASGAQKLLDMGWTCMGDDWWVTPGCAALSAKGVNWKGVGGCIPVLDDSWDYYKPELYKAMAKSGMALAKIMIGYDMMWEAVYYRYHNVPWFWWSTDSQFTVHQPVLIAFNYELISSQFGGMTTMAWQPLITGASDQLAHLLTNMQLRNVDVDELMKEVSAASENGYTAGEELGPATYQKIACDFLRKHRAMENGKACAQTMSPGTPTCWEDKWLPDPRKCSKGSGYNAGTLACEACPAGRSAARSKTDGIPYCVNCKSGRAASLEGSVECTICTPGTYSQSGTTGATTCSDCPIGTYSTAAEAAECKSCPGDFNTTYPRQKSQQACGCAGGQYLQNAAGSVCGTCPDGFACSGGNMLVSNAVKHNMPVVEERHYASSSEPYKAFLCVEAGTNCLGGTANSCGGGRHGMQCAMCDSGKVASKNGGCEDCTGFQYVTYPLCIVIALGALCAIHMVNNNQKGQAFTQMPLFSVVGQIVAQVQMIALMTSYDLTPPPAVQDMLDVLALFLFDMEALSTSCYFGFSLVAKYAPGVLLPVGIVVFMVLLYILSRVTKVITGKAMGVNNVINTLGLVLSALSVAVFKSSLSVLECRINPSAEDTLKNYDGYLCFGDEVQSLMPLTILAFLFFAVGGTCTYGYVLVKGPKAFWKSQAFRQRFRFVLSRWHPTWYWWGGLQVTRNLFMCLVPVVSTEGVVQLILLFTIFAPMFFATLSVRPWREVVANWNDCILSTCFVFIIFLSAFFMGEPKDSTRKLIGWLVVVGLISTFTVVGVISLDMIAVVFTGKGVIVKSNSPDTRIVDLFVQTMSKWSFLNNSGKSKESIDTEALHFLQQLPQTDRQRLEFFLHLMQTGLFAESPSRRISGISPVAPRAQDDDIAEMKRRMDEGAGENKEENTLPIVPDAGATVVSIRPIESDEGECVV